MLDSQLDYTRSHWCLEGRALHHKVHCPSDGCYARCPPVYWYYLVDMKDATVSSGMSRRVVVGTMNKLQIPATFSRTPGLASRFLKDFSWAKTFPLPPQKMRIFGAVKVGVGDN